MDQRLLLLRRAGGEPEQQLGARAVIFQFDQAQRGDHVGQRRSHIVRHAMEQDFLFLNFRIQTLMGDDSFARALQDGLFRFERFTEPLDQQNGLAGGGHCRCFELHFHAVVILLNPRSRFGAVGAAFFPTFLGVDEEVFEEGRSVGQRQSARRFRAPAKARRATRAGSPTIGARPIARRVKRTKPSASSTA